MPIFMMELFSPCHRRLHDQGGDPLGQGTATGYRSQMNPRRVSFDRPYILAMANSGPGTNGHSSYYCAQLRG